MSDSSSFHATDSDAYERQMGRWSSRLAELFLDFAGPAVGRCLDLGCGTGNLSAALLRLAPAVRVTGLDFSLTYVAHAEARPDTAGAEFRPAVRGRQLRPDSVAEIRRVTRPGGVAAATVWDARGGLAAVLRHRGDDGPGC